MKNALVVGFGLAGAALASQLQAMGKSFHVIDLPKKNVSSSKAAGVLNPVVLKRLNPVWRATEFYPYALEYYSELNAKSTNNFFYQEDIVQLLPSAQAQNLWNEKQADPFLGNYLKDIVKAELAGHANIAQAKYTAAYRLDVNSYLGYLRDGLSAYTEEQFDMDEVDFYTEGLRYKGESYEKLFLCMGVEHNLAGIQITRGQYSLTDIPGLKLDSMLKGKHFVIPKGKSFLVGASFSFKNNSLEPNEDDLREFSSFLKEDLALSNFTFTSHTVGLRAASKDRKPIMGQLSPSCYVLNGLGARGVLMSPLLANMLVKQAYETHPLPKELDLKRFNS